MRVIKKQLLSLGMSLCATIAGASPSILQPTASLTLIQNTSEGTSFTQDIQNIINNATIFSSDERAANVDAYFALNNLPLTGYGKVFVSVADKYNLDYRLLPAIAMRESTGGKKPCWNDDDNVFGWNSCKTKFDSQEQAIDKVGAHLAGAIKSTSTYYANKTVWKKLRTYNSVIKAYPDQVVAIMNKIEKTPMDESIASASGNSDIALK